MNGERGVRYHRQIAFVDEREREMPKALFRSDDGDGFFLRVDTDTEPAFIMPTDFASEIEDAARGRVAVVPEFLRGFGEFINNRLRRGLVWIAHPQVNNVDTQLSAFVR